MLNEWTSKTARKRLGLALLPLVLVGLTGCSVIMANQVRSEKAETRSFAVTGEPTVTVETFNGSIEAQPGVADKVEATVKKIGSGSTQEAAEADLKNIVVEFAQEGNNVRIVVRHTKSRRWGSSGASVELKVPVQSILSLKTSNGSIEAEDVGREIQARTTNGEINVSGARGKLDLESTNGRIEIEAENSVVNAETTNGDVSLVGSLAQGKHRLETSNGGIELRLPSKAVFLLDARTSNGSVATGFNSFLSTSPKKRANQLAGQVGSGEPNGVEVSLHTSNGNIVVEPREVADKPAPAPVR